MLRLEDTIHWKHNGIIYSAEIQIIDTCKASGFERSYGVYIDYGHGEIQDFISENDLIEYYEEVEPEEHPITSIVISIVGVISIIILALIHK